MAYENPNRLAEWLIVLREQGPVLRRRFAEWLGAVREEPVLLWHTPAVRCAAYILAGLLFLWVATAARDLMLPAPSAGAKPVANTADFHVVCSDQHCAHHYLIRREFGFHRFPVKCPKCRKPTGTRARRCNSTTCRGRWVAPADTPAGHECPICRTPLPDPP